MYHLTLTADERKAIDWVGYRYEHGDDFYKLLIQTSMKNSKGEDVDWDYEGDITFEILEHAAFEIQQLLWDSQFECFAEPLVRKLVDFIGQSV